MNQVQLVGNLTRDPEGGTTQSGISYCRFTVACQRRFPNAQGVREADFISCTAWRQTAELIQRYFSKGSRIGLVGSIQTGSYTAQDGSKRYTTEVLVDNVEFVSSRSDSGGQTNRNGTIPGIMQPPRNQQQRMDLTGQQDNGGFMEVDDDELPF